MNNLTNVNALKDFILMKDNVKVFFKYVALKNVSSKIPNVFVLSTFANPNLNNNATILIIRKTIFRAFVKMDLSSKIFVIQKCVFLKTALRPMLTVIINHVLHK